LRRALRIVLLLGLAVAIGFSIDSARKTLLANASKRSSDEASVRSTGLVAPVTKGLVDPFTDLHGRMLADPPSDATKLLDPQTLVVSHIISNDPESPPFPWVQFEAHLAEVTGRKVVDEVYDNGPEAMDKLKDGRVTIVALHAADAPFIVNNYGFQPAAVLGDEVGASGNHLDIIVPQGSEIASPADLRAQSLVCTVPTSITGYRAAIVLLAENQGLRPNLDYYVTWSLKQTDSILGVAQKKYQAAAVSDDKLQTMLQAGDIAKTDFRQIYQSDVIPRTTIGWFYNLKPELAGKVKEAVLSFRPAAPTTAPSLADASDNTDSPDAPGKQLHFIPIDYKKDFQLVRLIDDRFDPRLNVKPKTSSAATTEPSAP
jgi:phosphonate transport system substrate-binding protein